MGSPGHAKVQQYLRARLKGVEVEEDKFLASTPAGEFQLRNFIAKFPGKKDGIIVVAGHYDTEYGIKNFVGANDGGSSTALLLAIADQLRGKKREGYSVWLVWFDGEEAVREFTETDGLYGSRHLAERWRADGTLKKIRALLLTDMIGDSDLHIDRDTNSTEWLLDVVQEAAQRLGYQSYFFRRQAPVVDDHIPFIRAGVPAVDLIDFNYGYENVFWHTPQDTLDKVAPKSLEIVGSVVMEAVRILDER
jgi:glutaminyl-peptide cyclotransferase